MSNKILCFETDTGACKTVMAWDVFKNNYGNYQLDEVAYKLSSVTGQAIKAIGEAVVNVYKGKIKYVLPLTIVESQKNFTPLLGRDWLNVLFPGWQKTFTLAQMTCMSVTSDVEDLKSKYKSVFEPDLTRPIKEFEVKLAVKENVNPIFKKAYNMPYALRPKVEEKLNLLIKAGIIEPVTNSEWASPIVVVPKKGGDVRICVDFRVSLNKVLVPEQYPLHTVDDIFASLTGGEVFTVLDLTGAEGR